MDVYLKATARDYYCFLRGDAEYAPDRELISRKYEAALDEIVDYCDEGAETWLSPTEKRLKESFRTPQDTYDGLVARLEKRLERNYDTAIIGTMFALIVILELAGAIGLPIFTWHHGHQSIGFTILMVLVGMIGGAFIPAIGAMPVWFVYDRRVRGQIAWLVARIVAIETRFRIETDAMEPILAYEKPPEPTEYEDIVF